MVRHVCRRAEVLSAFWVGNLRERYLLEDLGVDGGIFKWIFNKYYVMA
jgi:hypothetical protein